MLSVPICTLHFVRLLRGDDEAGDEGALRLPGVEGTEDNGDPREPAGELKAPAAGAAGNAKLLTIFFRGDGDRVAAIVASKRSALDLDARGAVRVVTGLLGIPLSLKV